MRLHHTHFALAALVLGTAHAQDAAIETLAQANIERQIAIGEAFEATLGVAGEMGPERVVKGAPYCADAVHETVQWLPDGLGGAPNRIVRQQNSRLCRDGEGRTRQEVERGGRKLVYLRDPVAGENWVLDPERKSARRLGGWNAPAAAFDAAAMRDFGERMRDWARQMSESTRRGPGAPPAPPAPPVPPTPPIADAAPAPVVISRVEDGRTHTEVRVLRGSASADMPPPQVQWRAMQFAPRGAGSVQPLPARDIEGVRAHGERTSWVIEAGKLGNEKPIQITREVWTAPELMLTLASRDFDPRSGEASYRLKNLKRGEPDAALMKVPTEYARPVRPAASRATG
jgi:hypothetical protein